MPQIIHPTGISIQFGAIQGIAPDGMRHVIGNDLSQPSIYAADPTDVVEVLGESWGWRGGESIVETAGNAAAPSRSFFLRVLVLELAGSATPEGA